MPALGCRGVVLAGGSGSRLLPLTKVQNKHALPMGDGRLMIEHPIGKLVEAGVTDIMLVTGNEHAGALFQYLGDGSDFGASFTYRVQHRPSGICGALALAEQFVDGEPFVVVLGDNIWEASLMPFVRRFIEYAGARSWDARGMVLLSEVEDPQRFGVARFDEAGALVELVEKPAEPPSKLIATGIYLLAGSEVFEIIRSLKPSGRGELEVSELLTAILRKGRLTWDRLPGWWSDAGEHASYWRANELVRGAGRRVG